MAVSAPAIKISAVATTLMSINVKRAITRATPRSEPDWHLVFFMITFTNILPAQLFGLLKRAAWPVKVIVRNCPVCGSGRADCTISVMFTLQMFEGWGGGGGLIQS